MALQTYEERERAREREESRRETWRMVMLPTLIVIAPLVIYVVLQAARGEDTGRPQNVTGLGLAYAAHALSQQGFENQSAHDAYGRDRKLGQLKDWRVCVQPSAGQTVAYRTEIDLAVVRVTERCPVDSVGNPVDQGVRRPVPPGTISDLVGRTALMASLDVGEYASIRFVDPTGRQVTSGLGDWVVCAAASDPPSGDVFRGQPIRTDVVRFGDACPAT